MKKISPEYLMGALLELNKPLLEVNTKKIAKMDFIEEDDKPSDNKSEDVTDEIRNVSDVKW